MTVAYHPSGKWVLIGTAIIPKSLRSDNDPKFTDLAAGNLRLRPDSPCIDAADNTAVPPDFLDSNGNGNTNELMPLDLDRMLSLRQLELHFVVGRS